MKKKVLFLIECMSIGGAEKVLIDLVNNLDKNKYNITVMMVFKYNTYGEREFIFNKYFDEHINVKYMFNNKFDLGYKLYNVILNRIDNSVIHKIFIGNKYDIEIAFYEGLPTKIISKSNNAKSFKIAWLHTDSGNRTAKFSENMIQKENMMYKRFNKIIAVSKAVEKSFNNIHSNISNTCVKYNPIDTNEIIFRSQESIDIDFSGELKLIAIGRLVEVKGFKRLINVVKRLSDENYNIGLTIIGDGPLKDDLKHIIKLNNIDERINVIGFKKNPYKYLKKSDVLVCSSFAEGYSTVALEAITLNIPIITTKCSGMEEVFGDRECGIICDNSENGLYEAIKEILTKKYLINKFKQECKLRAVNLRIDNTIKKIEEIL